MTAYARKLSPARGNIFTRYWFIIIFAAAAIAIIIGLGIFGTLDISGLFSHQVLLAILCLLSGAVIVKVFSDSRFIDYSLETDYNSELKLGKKRGEFSLNIEGKTFYGVDCGGTKLILLQGAPANHEKKVLTPSISSGKIFSLQSFRGRKLNRLVLRGIPVTDVNVIIRLGWMGIEAVESNQQSSKTVTNLKNLITSSEWGGVIWVAPCIPDDLYKQFLFNEKSLSQIETIYEGKLTNIGKDFNHRLEELKEYFHHTGSEVLHQSVEIVKTTIESYEIAFGLITYMLAKNPQEIQDAMTALNLEANKDSLPDVMERKLREIERLKDMFERVGAVIGAAPPEVKTQLTTIEKTMQGLRNTIDKLRGPKPVEASPVVQS